MADENKDGVVKNRASGGQKPATELSNINSQLTTLGAKAETANTNLNSLSEAVTKFKNSLDKNNKVTTARIKQFENLALFTKNYKKTLSEVAAIEERLFGKSGGHSKGDAGSVSGRTPAEIELDIKKKQAALDEQQARIETQKEKAAKIRLDRELAITREKERQQKIEEKNNKIKEEQEFIKNNPPMYGSEMEQAWLKLDRSIGEKQYKEEQAKMAEQLKRDEAEAEAKFLEKYQPMGLSGQTREQAEQDFIAQYPPMYGPEDQEWLKQERAKGEQDYRDEQAAEQRKYDEEEDKAAREKGIIAAIQRGLEKGMKGDTKGVYKEALTALQLINPELIAAVGWVGALATALVVLGKNAVDAQKKSASYARSLKEMGESGDLATKMSDSTAASITNLSNKWENAMYNLGKAGEPIIWLFVKLTDLFTTLLGFDASDPEYKEAGFEADVSGRAKQSGFSQSSASGLARGTYTGAEKLQGMFTDEKAVDIAKKLADAWLSGSDAAREYGIVLNDDVLTGWLAVTKGINLSTVEVTDAQKQAWRYELMQEQINKLLQEGNYALADQIKQWTQIGFEIDRVKNKLFAFDEVIQLSAVSSYIPEINGDGSIPEPEPTPGGTDGFVWPPYPEFKWPDYSPFYWPAYNPFYWPAYNPFYWPAYNPFYWPDYNPLPEFNVEPITVAITSGAGFFSETLTLAFELATVALGEAIGVKIGDFETVGSLLFNTALEGLGITIGEGSELLNTDLGLTFDTVASVLGQVILDSFSTSTDLLSETIDTVVVAGLQSLIEKAAELMEGLNRQGEYEINEEVSTGDIKIRQEEDYGGLNVDAITSTGQYYLDLMRQMAQEGKSSKGGAYSLKGSGTSQYGHWTDYMEEINKGMTYKGTTSQTSNRAPARVTGQATPQLGPLNGAYQMDLSGKGSANIFNRLEKGINTIAENLTKPSFSSGQSFDMYGNKKSSSGGLMSQDSIGKFYENLGRAFSSVPLPMPAYASGGIGTKEVHGASLFEGNKAEAVIPLESAEGINFLANAMREAMGGETAASGMGESLTVNVNLSGLNVANNDAQWQMVGKKIGEIIDNQHMRRGSLSYGS